MGGWKRNYVDLEGGKKWTKKNFSCDTDRLKARYRNPVAERGLWGCATSSLLGAIQKMRHPSRWCTQLHLWVTGRPIMGSAHEDKWVSRASSCLRADSHLWTHVSFVDCCQRERLVKGSLLFSVPSFILPGDTEAANGVDCMTPSGWDTMPLSGVCHCMSSRPRTVSIATKSRLWGDRAEPARWQFTRFTRRMWGGRVNLRNHLNVEAELRIFCRHLFT